MTRFCEFAGSPYFNKHRETRLLIEHLGGLYPRLEPKNCDRYQLFQSIFPSSRHDQAQLALLFTYALRLLERFLAHEQLQAYAPFEQILLLRQLRQKQGYRFYESKMKSLDKQMTQYPYRDSGYFNYQYLRAEEADAYYTQLSQREMDWSIQQKEDNLDQYYLAVKLKDACEMLLRSRILRVEYDPGLLDAVLGELALHLDKYKENPSIFIYYHVYQLLLQEDTDTYEEVLKMVESQAHFFPLPELQNIFNYLQNFCIKQINQGSEGFLRASFELFKIQLHRQLLLDDEGFLPEWHYKNIVANGLRLAERDWVKQFIETHKASLRPETTENAYSYNLAAYYYSIKSYDKVLELLLRIEYTDLYYNLDSKAILLRTYYDLDEYEAFLSLNQSFQQFVRRNKLVSDFQRKGYIHLLQLTKRAFQIKINSQLKKTAQLQQSILNLLQQIKDTNPVHNRSWLVARVHDLQKK